MDSYLDGSLTFTAKVYKWMLLEDHETIKSSKGSLQSINLSNLLNRLESFNFCSDIETKEYNYLLQKLTLTDSEKNKNLERIPFQSSNICRVEHCTLLSENSLQN